MKRYSETIKLEKLVPGGQALGLLPSDKKVFVWGGLPGETIEAEIFKSKSTYAEATTTKVLESSPNRIVQQDECYLSTSPWQIMDYDYELSQKSNLIQESFAQQGIELGQPVRIVTDGRKYEYRNKMEYSLWWDNDTRKISLAFHKRGTHQKIPIEKSSIERPEILDCAKQMVTELNARSEQARKYQLLLARCSQDGKVSAELFENSKPHPRMTTLEDKLLGHNYSYSPNGFFQINLPVYEMALNAIKGFIETDDILDLYAGVGTIGLSVARDRNLTLVETNPNAFNELERNLPDGTNSITAIHAKSEDVLDYIKNDGTVIVDPPRAGLDSKIIDKLKTTKPPVVIYLSCNPITQARDIAPLLDSYNIKHVCGYNFFPRTPHIENLVVLEKS